MCILCCPTSSQTATSAKGSQSGLCRGPWKQIYFGIFSLAITINHQNPRKRSAVYENIKQGMCLQEPDKWDSHTERWFRIIHFHASSSKEQGTEQHPSLWQPPEHNRGPHLKPCSGSSEHFWKTRHCIFQTLSQAGNSKEFPLLWKNKCSSIKEVNPHFSHPASALAMKLGIHRIMPSEVLLWGTGEMDSVSPSFPWECFHFLPPPARKQQAPLGCIFVGSPSLGCKRSGEWPFLTQPGWSVPTSKFPVRMKMRTRRRRRSSL